MVNVNHAAFAKKALKHQVFLIQLIIFKSFDMKKAGEADALPAFLLRLLDLLQCSKDARCDGID